MPRGCGVADRRGHAGIGHRHDHVGVDGIFARQLRAHRLAHVIDRAAMDDGIGPGEIDIFEDAGACRLRREGLVAVDALVRDHDDFAILDVADEMRADDVERAGFGGQDVMAVELAEHQRADAEGIARADELLVAQGDEGIGAFDLAQGLDEAFDDPSACGCAPRDAARLRCRRSTGRSRRRGSIRGGSSGRW